MTESRSVSILAHTKDSPALVASGYARLGQYTAPALMDAGYDVKLFCPVGHQSSTIQWEEPHSKRVLDIWSLGNGSYGEDIVPAHLANLERLTGKPGILLFAGDVIALDHIIRLNRERQITSVAWGAVDWEWPSPQHARDKWSSFYRAWPMSHHGCSVLGRDRLSNLLEHVWLGVNTDLWKPIDRSQLADTMREMGYREDGFNVFSCFANQFQRKGEAPMLLAIREFHRRHPEAKIHFYGMTQVRRDWDFAATTDYLGIRDLVSWSDDYRHHMGWYPEEDIARMMNCSDLVLSLGYEGFGLQTVEAQSLGKMVIGLNAAATPELLQSGFLVEPADEAQLAPALIARRLPTTQKVLEALEHAYEVHRSGQWRGDAARRWVVENATWAHTGRALVQRLESVEQSLADEEFLPPLGPGPKGVELGNQEVLVE